MVAGSDMNENIQQTGEDIICTRHTLDQLCDECRRGTRVEMMLKFIKTRTVMLPWVHMEPTVPCEVENLPSLRFTSGSPALQYSRQFKAILI